MYINMHNAHFLLVFKACRQHAKRALGKTLVIPDYVITVPGMLVKVATLFCTVGCVSLGLRLSVNSLLKECCNIVE